MLGLSLGAILLILPARIAGSRDTAGTDTSSDAAEATVTVTISGTVTGPGGSPVPDVVVSVESTTPGFQETTTDLSGYYSVTIQTEGTLMFRIRPPFSTRLAQINQYVDGVTSDRTFGIELVNGYLVNVQPTAGGVPFIGPLDWEILALEYPLEVEQSYEFDWDAGEQRYQAVLPPDIYWLAALDVPTGYYDTRVPVDLRSADVTATVPLNAVFVHPIPYEPPNAAQITIGPVDDLGEAVVTGTAGAAMPLARVVLVNLNGGHQVNTVSEPDGSFAARIYAPPGSHIMVKHGPASDRWVLLKYGLSIYVNQFPSTVIYVPHTHPGGPGQQPFADAGGITVMAVDNFDGPPNYVGAAWAITGTLGPSRTVNPGDTLQFTATLRVYGPAITTTTDVGAIAATGQLAIEMQHNAQALPIPRTTYAGSTLLTPSGFPVQLPAPSARQLTQTVEVTDFYQVGDHAAETKFTASFQVPVSLPLGIYRPSIQFDFAGVPTSTQWLAAVIPYAHPDEARLPPIAVNDGFAPALEGPLKLSWHLLANDVVQGTRGTAAREEHHFGFATQIVFQGAPHYVPPVDVRTGQSITYRLEPFLPMISNADRRLPYAPLIPFNLPGGQLHVTVQEPDGMVHNLGSEPFAQSFQRDPSTRGGYDYNPPGTTQVNEIYSLMAASDRFRVVFDQYGHHVVTMTGAISDVWGNSYVGGGTYDLWVAHPLDIDPGVLPGTPLEADDAFNPTVQLYPRVSADVNLSFYLYPDSDPTQEVVHHWTGRANQFGYYGPSGGFTCTHPGEYRVDLTATYSDETGTLYMGTMTWGGVVMSPDDETDLVAHGRRGLDALEYIPPAWFVHRDLSLPPTGTVIHTLNPYYNGDLLWTRMSDKSPYGGDSLVLVASVEDPVGAIETAILSRATRMDPELQPPGTLVSRTAVGELPLFVSTLSGLPPQLVMGQTGWPPPDVDMVAYAYRSSQRPGMRVREAVGEDGESGGYWRLDTLYDNQSGVGVLGDQVNDYKFQYVGLVYRDLETGHSEYLGQGTGWVFISDSDETGSRSMPPFAGYGSWTGAGGPIMTLMEQPIHIFILPTGVRPGAVLDVGDEFIFAGHIMPTLDSKVAFTVTAPGGSEYPGGGQANSIGYFYDPDGNVTVNEPGLWSVDVHVWHDGAIGNGNLVNCATIPSSPCPSGDVLGSSNGRYWFYVVPPSAPRLNVSSPAPGFLTFGDSVAPIPITGTVPFGLSGEVVSYTISMAGFVLQTGQVTPSEGIYEIVFDPAALNADFPNLDLTSREDAGKAGLADTFAIGLLLQGSGAGGTVHRANAVTIQGEQVFVDTPPPTAIRSVYLPLVLRYAPGL
jgi:hypothetical protein